MSWVERHLNRLKQLYSSRGIPSLVADLADDNPVVREKARVMLVALGKPAVAPLVEALSDVNPQVRWEAAKALGCLNDPAAAPALVLALGDKRFGTRWLAAEGLVALGPAALESLFEALLEPDNTVLLGEGAHHVLHELSKKGLGPWLTQVMTALNGEEPQMAVPLAAFTALKALRASPPVKRPATIGGGTQSRQGDPRPQSSEVLKTSEVVSDRTGSGRNRHKGIP